MKTDIFVDTSGFYALLAAKDPQHVKAAALLKKAAGARVRFVTTDYVLDETATLLKARGLAHLLDLFFGDLTVSHACRTLWTDAADFARARDYFLQHKDKDYSFTDCVSFCAMKSEGLHRALTTDAHFRQAGFEPLLEM
ncbi:MAG: PIN domain-containing protein [bacterium]|jgi:predicted nucleic acid-binding protein